MKFTATSIAALSLALTTTAIPNRAPRSENEKGALQHWPVEAAKALNQMISKNANQSNYAVFDADNTSWRYDIEESSIPYLENKGILSRETMDPSLQLIPFKDTETYKETLYSYYLRLCAMDSLICYPWAAQIYAGLTLRVVKEHIDTMLAENENIPVIYWGEGDFLYLKYIDPAKVFTGQVELFNELQRNGIDVWVVSASNEEIVRFVMSDPKYGYNVKPERVLGVSTMMRLPDGNLTTSRKQIQEGTYNQTANLDLQFGSYLWTPATWYAGKWAAVTTYIDAWKKPVLAAGDTPGSDTYMHFNVDIEKGGIHLWVNGTEEKMEKLQRLIDDAVKGQKANNLPITADKNWVVVKPEDIA
ncbi:hypothetical protein HYALB_00010265 [Hymenoscyphus albidus]|uniref:Phosphorylcholine phosphatase n=1 Tax=Hymenoscyphus albidus TaxID=595503 RepID=A0A9N9Q9P4_9HELO|nr:hypothetical protein HYALB_00010265 [Hymenoscyphus albidus]